MDITQKTYNKLIGNAINNLREEQNLNLDEFGEHNDSMDNLTKSTVSRIISGKTSLGRNTIPAIRDTLNFKNNKELLFPTESFRLELISRILFEKIKCDENRLLAEKVSNIMNTHIKDLEYDQVEQLVKTHQEVILDSFYSDCIGYIPSDIDDIPLVIKKLENWFISLAIILTELDTPDD